MIKFNIITVSLNSEKYISQTIQSVVNQTYKNFEYIIIDGGSSDNTLNIIDSFKRKCPGQINYTTGPDKGIYDAMNKGLRMIENPNTYVIFLNSDDYFYDNYVLEKVSSKASGADFIYGKIELKKGINSRIFGYEYNQRKLLRRTICHQAIFAKRSLFDRTNYFNSSYRIAGDHDFILKVFRIKDIKITFLPEIISSVRATGLASKNILLGREEYIHLLRKAIKPGEFGLYLMVHFVLIPRVLLLNIIHYMKSGQLGKN